VVDVLKACLQRIGVEQSKSDCVIQNVRKRFVDATDTSSTTTDASECSGSEIEAKASPLMDSKEKQKAELRKNGGRTMMVCNIPCNLSHAELVEAIESIEGNRFRGTFEFAHIPELQQHKANLGYAYVQFFQRKDAERFALAFEGFRFEHRASTKACTVKVAAQGSIGKQRAFARTLRLAVAQRQSRSP
jgi:hypothetical protein